MQHLEKWADVLDTRVEPVSRYVNAAGALTALFMVVLVSLHVTGRSLFNKPLVGTVELEELMIVVLVFSGMAFTQVKGNHISVDFLTMRLSEGLRGIISVFTDSLTTFLFAVMAWQSGVLSMTYLEEGMATFQLRIPLFWVLWVISAGFVLFSLTMLSRLFRSMAGVIAAGCGKWAAAGIGVAGFIMALPVLTEALFWEPSLRAAQIFGVTALLLFLFSGMLIGAGLGFLGYLGMAVMFGTDAGLGLFRTVPYSMSASYSLCVIPFFILMGELCFQTGLSEKLYNAAYKWVGQFRGGLSMATVLACGAFSAVSGSSLATAATMGAVSLPEMKRFRYAETLATGSIAAGGTIGILIPPSTVLIIYGILVEVSIAELFFAGIIPGLLSLVYYTIAIVIWTRLNPEVGPPGPRVGLGAKLASLKETWEVLCLFLVIMGGGYTAVFLHRRKPVQWGPAEPFFLG